MEGAEPIAPFIYRIPVPIDINVTTEGGLDEFIWRCRDRNEANNGNAICVQVSFAKWILFGMEEST
ncbi:MAG: hypothetical protein CXT67_09725 [Methanobacteriota archaeon]|nr:MAG: hypothetical protein CXT67_09725 [Euryarchaeota archaeon]